MRTVEYSIPSWALPALINGDWSGLELEDCEKLENWMRKESAKHSRFYAIAPNESHELGFCHTNDIDNLGADCVLVPFDVGE